MPLKTITFLDQSELRAQNGFIPSSFPSGPTGSANHSVQKKLWGLETQKVQFAVPSLLQRISNMCRKIMIGRSSTLKWILMLAWLGSSRCFASFNTYEVGLRAGQCQKWCVNNAKPWSVKCAWDSKDCSGCPECSGKCFRYIRTHAGEY